MVVQSSAMEKTHLLFIMYVSHVDELALVIRSVRDLQTTLRLLLLLAYGADKGARLQMQEILCKIPALVPPRSKILFHSTLST